MNLNCHRVTNKKEEVMRKETDTLDEGLSDAMAKTTALAIKRKVIVKGKQVRNTPDIEKKLDYLSIQLSSIAAIALLAVSLSGDQKSILSRAGVVSGLFSEDYPDDK